MADALVLPRAIARLRRGRHASQALLVMTFVASVIGFCGAAIYGELRLRRVDVRLDAIADDALPSIVSLTTVRTELHALDSSIGREIVRGRSSLDIGAATKAIRAGWSAYAASVHSDAESFSLQTGAAVDDAVHALAAVHDLAVRGREEEARADSDDARTKVDRADSMLGSLIDLRVDEARSLAQRAQESRVRTARMSLGLDSLTVICAALAAAIAMLALRRYGRSMETRAAELEAFAERVAHDIRGPLGPAMMSIEIAEKRMAGEGDIVRALGRGKRSLGLVASLVEDLLAFARSGAAPAPDAHASVRRTLNDVLDELGKAAADAGIELAVGPFDDVPVACAAGVLASILGNLIRNAIVHMGDAPRRRIDVAVAPRDRYDVEIRVTDTGPGIDAATRASIFLPHVRSRSSGGLGLGLATVKRLVQSHRGAVDVSEAVGGGCVFTVVLPRARRWARGS